MANDNSFSLVKGWSCLVAFLLFQLTAGRAWAQNPVPFINEPLVPAATDPGGAAFTLTVNGTGFVPGSVVQWNGSPRTTTFVSRSQLKATILSSDIASAHTARVNVVNPTPGGGVSNIDFFQITAPSTPVVFTESTQSTEVTQRMATADLNRDGKLDLVGSIGNGSNLITIRLGNGDGTFWPELDYPTACGASDLIVRDFNGDGKLDIAAVCPSFVSVLLGNGDGTFQPHIDSHIDPGPHVFGIAAGDFNSDGKLDLVVGYQDPASNAVSVLLGKGDGTFEAPVDYATGNEPGAVTVADLNQDGKLDIIAANWGNFGGKTVSVLLGNGDGTFKPQAQYTTSNGPLSVIVADFNGDGKLDLAVDCACGNATTQCGYPGAVSILLGNGDGTFRAHVDYNVAAFPYTVSSGDYNGDGKLDLLIPDLDTAQVSLLLGNGDGTFGAAVLYGPTGNSPVGVVPGDFNGDGALDAVIGTASGFTTLLQATTVGFSKTNLTFGDHVVTSSTSQAVTLANGELPLTISSIAVTGTNATDFSQTNTCGSGLPRGGRCTISVTFTPTQLGPRTASVNITDDALGSPQTVALSGTGVVSGPNATLSATSLTFATQLLSTASAAQSVTLTNYGTVAFSITGIGFTGADPGDFDQTNTCGSSVAPGASCTINVTFKPTGINERTASLSIKDNAPGSPHTVSLTAEGTVVELNPAGLAFHIPYWEYVGSMTSILTNTGSTTLTITGITTGGSFSQTNNCGSIVAAGKSCTITVTFRPPERLRWFYGAVSVSDNGGGSPQQLPLSGFWAIRLSQAPIPATLHRPTLAEAQWPPEVTAQSP